MNTTTQLIAIAIGLSALIGIGANILTAARGSARPMKDHPLLYEIPSRWATVGGPIIGSVAILISAAAGIAALAL